MAGAVGSRSFPIFPIGMIAGAILAAIGLFLIGYALTSPVTKIIGFILFLVGVAIFAL